MAEGFILRSLRAAAADFVASIDLALTLRCSLTISRKFATYSLPYMIFMNKAFLSSI